MASPSAKPRSRLIPDSQCEFTLISSYSADEAEDRPEDIGGSDAEGRRIADQTLFRITASNTANNANSPARTMLRGSAMAARNRTLTRNSVEIDHDGVLNENPLSSPVRIQQQKVQNEIVRVVEQIDKRRRTQTIDQYPLHDSHGA